MENWYTTQTLLVAAIQGSGAWLEAPMHFFSFLGSEEFFVLALPVLYWSIDAALGLRIGLILLVSAGFNDALKMALHTPRPYWFSPQITPLAAETSFGLPSGHSQNTVAIWGSLAAYIGRRWLWPAAGAVMFLVGFSRMYLGVHFPQDVLLGWGIGALLLWAFTRYWTPAANWLKNQTPGKQILLAAGISLLIVIAGTLPYLGLSGWTFPPDWAGNAVRAGDPLPDPVSMRGLLTSAGTFFGLAAGLVWMNSQGGYQASGPAGKRVLRLLIGLLGILALRYGLGAIFPDGENLLAFALRFLRYSLIGLWVSGGAPWGFVRLKLANAAQ